MMKSFAASLTALALLAGPALAQSSCDPAKLADAIDRYAQEPFSARSWRVVQGLGDPMLEPGSADADTWAQQEEWRKLTSAILPDQQDLQNVGWSCRIGYPLSVLKTRIDQLGAQDPYVKQWLLAQQQVIRACSGDDGEISLPEPLADAPAVANRQKADRAYQEASIAFYRDRQKAIPLFKAIAASTSIHRAAAAYNVANLLANAKQPVEARIAADAILADPSMASVHEITRQLLGYIANQEDTAQGWTGLIDGDIAILETPAAQILADDGMKRQYSIALYDIDFVGIRKKEGDWWLDGTLPADATISKSIVDASRQHPMALWMMAGQTANEKYQMAPWSLVGTKWQDRMAQYVGKALAVQPTGAKLQGPALAMLKALAARPDDASRAELWSEARQALDTAENSCGAAPETAAAGLLLNHAVRLSALAGKYDEAEQGLAAAPAKTSKAYAGALYNLAQYQAAQGDTAASRKLRDALITPELLNGMSGDDRMVDRNRFSALLAYVAEDQAQWKDAVLRNSDPGSDITFNFLPTKSLWALADDQSFTPRDRALFARAAWTRDYGLVRKVDGEHLAKLHALNPEIKAIFDQVKVDYPAISPRNQRLLTILRSPPHNILVSMPGGWQNESIRPDSFTEIDGWNPNDKNWWCPYEPDRQLGAIRKQADNTTGFPDYFDWISKRIADVYDPALREPLAERRDAVLNKHPMVRSVDWKELRALSRMPQGPERLSRAAIDWGKASKGKDGAPEALALAVRTTRYGCNWHGGHAAYSKPAQQLLATKFAGTEWQKQTPYWFDCRRTMWNKDFTEKVTTCEPMTWPKQAPLK
ncbi:hypothetical protein DK847_10960 [Aestuariivirga litoralis]|uniref:Uncharacterized protein n=1 Tax=Aestuariivirga litoralis TaxID=2650924 RepID=A0A2W2AN93_9HYPH|nr:hypothetical protein [Aestuariivirga litoralis]PZF76965.1 hypothetical protein DK847_10960 [Aestuariivirga litoralis]